MSDEDSSNFQLKQVLVEVYGHAAELVMDPKQTPPFYYTVFYSHARVASIMNEHEAAIKDCNWSAFLRPDLPDPLYLRGNSYLAIGNNYKACKNWNQAIRLGHGPSAQMAGEYCN